jgi:hypothetical protein
MRATAVRVFSVLAGRERPVRVLGGQHLAGVEVGHQPAAGGQAGRQVRRVLVHDDARVTQPLAADGLVAG